jgi:uncharacterized protein (DUF169 family)
LCQATDFVAEAKNIVVKDESEDSDSSRSLTATKDCDSSLTAPNVLHKKSLNINKKNTKKKSVLKNFKSFEEKKLTKTVTVKIEPKSPEPKIKPHVRVFLNENYKPVAIPMAKVSARIPRVERPYSTSVRGVKTGHYGPG